MPPLLGAREAEAAAQHAAAHQVVAADEHVLERRQVSEDAEILEAARDARPGELVGPQAEEVTAVEAHAADGGFVHARERVEQRALARAVRADHREQLAAADVEAHVLERGDRAEAEGEVADLEQRRPAHPTTSSATSSWPPAVPEVGAAHRIVEQELGRRPAHQRPPALQQVGMPGDVQRERRALVGEQDRRAGVRDAPQRLADLGDHDRRQPQRRLVEQQQPRLSHQRAADREHLLLAAAQQAGALVDALAQDREQLEHLVAQPPLAGAVARRERAEPEVLADRQIGEHAAALERLRDAERHQARRVERAASSVRRSGCHP